jgi:hypothetical protein
MASPFLQQPDSFYEVAKTIVLNLGVEVSETNVHQMEGYLKAFAIFIERNANHCDLWKEFGWEDSALHIRSKAARIGLVMKRHLEVPPENVLKEVPDLINYAIFFDRNVRGV